MNDTVDHAIELAELLQKWGSGYHVNLIPFNPIEGSEYKRPYRKAVSLLSSLMLSFYARPLGLPLNELKSFWSHNYCIILVLKRLTYSMQSHC